MLEGDETGERKTQPKEFPMNSMITYFKDMLKEGEADLSDPFNDATLRAKHGRDLTREEKAKLRRAWNNRIANMYGGEEALKTRMHARRAARCIQMRRG
jgi:hypothetical protein